MSNCSPRSDPQAARTAAAAHLPRPAPPPVDGCLAAAFPDKGGDTPGPIAAPTDAWPRPEQASHASERRRSLIASSDVAGRAARLDGLARRDAAADERIARGE